MEDKIAIFSYLIIKQICIQHLLNDWKCERFWRDKHEQDLKTHLVKEKKQVSEIIVWQN